MCKVIGPSPRANVVPGHSGPEEALVALYRLYRDDPEARRTVSFTGDPRRYLKLAQFFIDTRGHHEGRTGKDKSFEEYGQDHAPLAQQATLEGHAVRAALFCTGIAAAAYDDGRPGYLAAALRLWDSLVRHKMYITGAAGAVASDEKLGADYFLPNDGYMETCAAVGVGFFAQNMNLLFADAGYIDVLEQALYNAVPGGVSLTGDHYFYQNPLTGEGLRRWAWHDCPCCPPMFAKMMGALPGYLYAQEPGAVYVNLFAGSHASLSVEGVPVKLKQTTHYPWSGDVTITLDPERPAEFDLYVRIPAWAEGPASPNALYTPVGLPEEGAARIRINGQPIGKLDKARGYARLRREWRAGDVVELKLDMPVRQVKAHPSVLEDQGRVALTRGPIVYCVESVDVPEGPRHLVVPPDARLKAEYRPELLGGVAVLRGKVRVCSKSADRVSTEPAQLTAIPFHASANREPCSIRVWLAADPSKAVTATLATRSRVTASHCWQADSTAAVNDGVTPTSSGDTSQQRLSWWDHRGGTEWVQMTFPAPTKVSRSRVYWFADRPTQGGCDLPQAWRLLYQDGAEWKPVQTSGAFGLQPDQFNAVAFEPVRTAALRMAVDLKPGWSAGVGEWEVE
jgi:hypothetical protein